MGFARAILKLTPTLFTILFLLLGQPSYGWGLKEEAIPKSYWFKSHLIENVVNGREIRYAVEIKDLESFPEWSIRAQTEAALRLWLEPLQQAGIAIPKIVRVSPNDSKLDLLVKIGPDPIIWPGRNAAAHILSRPSDGRLYSLVAIDPKVAVDFGGGKKICAKDSRHYIRGPEKSFSERLMPAIKRYKSIDNWAKQVGESRDLLWNSTLPKLIHEIGHSFGLADTVSQAMLNQQSRPDLQSKTHGEGVMKKADYLLPQEDDRNSMLQLAKLARGAAIQCVKAQLDSLISKGQ